jgi:hypothetical protein
VAGFAVLRRVPLVDGGVAEAGTTSRGTLSPGRAAACVGVRSVVARGGPAADRRRDQDVLDDG